MTNWEPGVGVVELPDGRLVRGRGLHAHPGSDFQTPEFGVYLLGRTVHPGPWEHRFVRWPDFCVPLSTPHAMRALCEAYDRAADQRVELCCAGGTGRTGAGLAVLAALAGVEPDRAVAWVREHYRARAVETPWQERWVVRAAERAIERRSAG
ncbi:protein-tyrosine phosphatase family protein [Micromonospora sp. DT81.3]|uniref:protein-tyrosine phosphatase family protein n=1 Tax=Micromonospora sp. DT81.3 TaxID=3416523 RepID=UPI003CFAA805